MHGTLFSIVYEIINTILYNFSYRDETISQHFAFWSLHAEIEME